MCHGMAQQKVKVKTLDATAKIIERENNFEVEKVGRKNSVILNHVDSNHINTY